MSEEDMSSTEKTGGTVQGAAHPAERLTSATLAGIAAELRKLESLSVSVSSFDYRGYTVHVRRWDDQREGCTYFVTKIAPVALGGVLRGITGRGPVFDETST